MGEAGGGEGAEVFCSLASAKSPEAVARMSVQTRPSPSSTYDCSASNV